MNPARAHAPERRYAEGLDPLQARVGCMMEPSLALSEIFKSIEGETSFAGTPCAFVRTVGCNLHCEWCDTAYARSGEGVRLTIAEIREEVESFDVPLVCITGGEPLVQTDAVVALCAALLEDGYRVLLETNGTIDLSPLPRGVIRIMDVKCPGSGESEKTLPSNLRAIRPEDEVKFVMADREDFDWAEAFLEQHWPRDQRAARGGPTVLFAPVCGVLEAQELAEWILNADLRVRLQLQLQRILWPERDRGM